MSSITSGNVSPQKPRGILNTIHNWKLSTKLMAIILLSVLVPQLIATAINFPISRSQIISVVGEDILARQAESTSQITAQYIQRNVAIVETLTLNNQMVQTMISQNQQYQGSDEDITAQLLALNNEWRNGDESTPLIANVISSNTSQNPLTASLLGFQEVNSPHTEIFVADARGATVASTHLLADYYHADTEWWQVALRDGVFISDPEFDETLEVAVIQIGVPIEGPNGVVGALHSKLIFEEAFLLLTEQSFGDAGRVMLFDSENNLIADPGGNGEGALSSSFVQTLLDSDSVTSQGKSPGGVNSLYSAGKVVPEHTGDSLVAQQLQDTFAELGWTIVATEPVSEATSTMTRSNLLLLAITLVAALIGIVIAQRLLRPTLKQVSVMQPVLDAVRQGDYSARASVITGDELGDLAGSFNSMLDETTTLIQSDEERNKIQSSIMELLEEVSTVADGDMTVEATVREDITGAIADSLNFMVENLRDVLTQVDNSAFQLSSSANEIQTTSEKLADGSEVQAAQIVDTTAAVDEMAISIQQVSQNSALSETVGEEARLNAQRGAEAVRDTIEGMNRIRTQVQDTSKRIKRLGESTQEIGEMLQLIRTITKRTSILALNASIQAARAGEAGRSFMVVAEEVEQLADRSSDATRQIELLVHNIQSETNEAVTSMEATTHEVVTGSRLANEAGSRLAEIESVSERLAGLIQSISLAAQQQARGSETIAQSMNDISLVTQQTRSGSVETNESIRQLTQLAEELHSTVSTFKLDDQSGESVG